MISFPAGTWMVRFPASSPRPVCVPGAGDAHPGHRVTPFGHPGIAGYWLLPPAFRSWSRPSSSGGSKASPADPCSLDHIISPIPHAVCPPLRDGRHVKKQILEARGFEPLTLGLQSRCSSQLSHAPRRLQLKKSAGRRSNRKIVRGKCRTPTCRTTSLVMPRL